MRTIDDYSDDDLLRLLAKTVGVTGGKDRAAMIQAALDARGVKDETASFFENLFPTMPNAPADGAQNDAGQIMGDDQQ